jgi:hypothetical protein
MGKRTLTKKSGESDLQAVSEMIEYAYWLRMWARAGKRAQYAGCESLDDIAKDHVTHTDRRADGSGQNKVDTDDRQHGCSLGNEIPLHVWNTHECNNCTVTFGTSLVQLPLGQAPKRGK